MSAWSDLLRVRRENATMLHHRRRNLRAGDVAPLVRQQEQHEVGNFFRRSHLFLPGVAGPQHASNPGCCKIPAGLVQSTVRRVASLAPAINPPGATMSNNRSTLAAAKRRQ